MPEVIMNLSSYLQGMQKSLPDKLFFINRISEPIKCIVDFGCADGSLIHAMHEILPECVCVGYDNNPDMVCEAEKNLSAGLFFNDLQKLMLFLKKEKINPNETLLNLSSVLHEVYSYCSRKEIDEIYAYIFENGFKYIAIRDMGYSPHKNSGICDGFSAVDRTKNPDKLKIKAIREKLPQQIADFEQIWGEIDENEQNLCHFLLKYKYTENWKREVRENYFQSNACMIDEISRHKYAKQKYDIIHKQEYVLPYIQQQVQADFGITFPGNTHYQVLLKKR